MLIDLDSAPPAAGPPAWRRRPGWHRVTAVLVLVLALVGASAAPGRPVGVVEVLTVPGQGVEANLLTGEALYLVRIGGDVEAHPLCPGCPAWTSRATPGQRLTAAAGDTLIIDGTDEAVATVLDARTGALRWRLTGAPFVDVIDGRVAARGVDDQVLRLYDPRTGRLLWSRPAESYSSDGPYVVIVDDRGGATVIRAADGREVTARQPLGLPRPAAQLLADQVIVFGQDYLAAFRRDGLTRAWLTRGVGPYQVASCGDGLLCAVTASGLTVLDRDDGSIVWSGPNWRFVGADGVLSEEFGRTALVDMATGRIERELGGSALVGGLQLFPEPGRTSVLRMSDGRFRGTLPLVLPDACRAAGPYLSCETPNVTYTVWRVP